MADLPNLGLYRRLTALALVVGPALFLLDNILHPKEFGRGSEAKQLLEIGVHYQRWQFAHALGLLSAVIMTGALLGLAFHVRRSQPTLGLIGGALAVAGAIGLGAGFAIDGFTWGTLGAISTEGSHVEPNTVQYALHTVQYSHWLIPYYALIGQHPANSGLRALFENAKSDDLKWGNFHWLPLAAGVFFAIVIGLGLQRREVETPVHRLRRELKKVATGDLQRIDDHTSESVMKHANKIIGRNRRVVAEDGKTMTITYEGLDSRGREIKVTAIYDRQ